MMTTLYETHDRTVPGDPTSYRVSLRYSDAIDGPSEFVFVGSLAEAHGVRIGRGATYVKNFKQVGAGRR
jgi:hypothetical protein